VVGEVSLKDSALSDFRQGFLDILPIMIAYGPISMLWGTVAASKGLNPLEAWLMSFGVYSGSAQFVAMDLWQQQLPIWLLVFTIATVSLRHVLMSASISRHMQGFSKTKASILLFWLTDEAWALMERRAATHPITPAYYLGVAAPLWPVWWGFSLMGAWLGRAVGNSAAIGLDFAFAAMFIAVLAGFWKGPRTGGILIASATAAVAAKLALPGAWYIVIGGLAGMAFAVLTYRDERDA
jgi:4-azaleucine resistance transporter AzlC